MAQTISWSQESLDDIDSIAEYISRDSFYHAQRVVEIIFERVKTLTEQSESGRKVPELNDPNVRELYDV